MTKMLVANWKMNKLRSSASSYLSELKGSKDVAIWIAAPFTLIAEMAMYSHSLNIKVGAQNMNANAEGAFTGEISVSMLKDVGAAFILIGHSERRQIFKESNKDIQAKVERAVVEGMPFILCVGESENERESGETKQVIEEQLGSALDSLIDIDQIIVAYEPVWAIGSGRVAEIDQITTVHQYIKDFITKRFSTNIKTSILYGGSVNPENIKELFSSSVIDGALVGGASLDSKCFNEMISIAEGLC